MRHRKPVRTSDGCRMRLSYCVVCTMGDRIARCDSLRQLHNKTTFVDEGSAYVDAEGESRIGQFFYTQNRVRGEKAYLRCSVSRRFKCKATIVADVNSGYITSRGPTPHNHPPEAGPNPLQVRQLKGNILRELERTSAQLANRVVFKEERKK